MEYREVGIKKIKRNMNKEKNPVGRRGGGDTLHFECRNKAMEKNKKKRVSMRNKHLNRVKLFRKDKGGICGIC